MDRLEAVAHVRQRAADDDAHRVVEVARSAARPRWAPADPLLDGGRSCAAPRVALTLLRAMRLVGEAAAERRTAAATARGRRWCDGGAGGASADARRAGRGSRPRRRSAGRCGQRVADDPRAMAVVARCGRDAPRPAGTPRDRRSASTRLHSRSAHDRDFWTWSSASPMSWSDERQAGACRAARRSSATGTSCGMPRERRAHQPPFHRAASE